MRASTFDAAKSLRALHIAEAIDGSCVEPERPFVCNYFDSGTVLNYLQATSQPRNDEGESVFHDTFLPVKTHLGVVITAWNMLTQYKTTAAAFFAKVDGTDETADEDSGEAVAVEEDAGSSETDGRGAGEFFLSEGKTHTAWEIQDVTAPAVPEEQEVRSANKIAQRTAEVASLTASMDGERSLFSEGLRGIATQIARIGTQ